MKNVIETERCTACFACYNICPKKCISVKDEADMLYASINEEECINCQKCVNVCPIQNKIKTSEPIKTYAAWSLDSEIRKTSSSGGIATQLYEFCIEHGWFVVGTKFDENLRLNYTLTNSIEDVKSFKGSKYVQSFVNDIYIKIKQKLNENTNVLFIGLPCHVAGLKSYLKKEYDNLVTIDLICHGVGPKNYLKKHINYIEKKCGKKVDNVTFRENNEKTLRVYSNNKIIYEKQGSLDTYYRGFLTGLFFRDSCYNCNFSTLARVSDITLGDFWGLGKQTPFNYSTEDGVSLVLVNSNKGNELMEQARDKFFLEERKLDEATKYNKQLSNPSQKNKKYEYFKKQEKKYDFEKAAKRTLNKDIIILKIKMTIKKLIGQG